MTKRSNKNGFTLLELLIALSILGILATVGIPSYSQMKENSSFSSGYNNLNSAYRIARAEAIKTSTSMVIAAVGGNWGDGWTVENEDTGDIIFQAPAVKGGWIVTATNDNDHSDGENKIRFLGDGSFDTNATGNLLISDAGNTKMKKICIFRSAQSYLVESGGC